MFYPELLACLSSNAAVATTVSSYSGVVPPCPAIFRNEAPEDAVTPYIVVRIDNVPTLDRVIMKSNIYVDFYDFENSRANGDDSAVAVQNLLDSTIIQSDNFSDIRILLLSGDYVPVTDPRTIHYNSTFSSRGTRKKWMQHISQ